MKSKLNHSIVTTFAAFIAAIFLTGSVGDSFAQTKQSSLAPSSSDKKPNIIIIWGDDIGWFHSLTRFYL